MIGGSKWLNGTMVAMSVAAAACAFAVLAFTGPSWAQSGADPFAPTDISQPTNANEGDLLLLYKHTVYNNFTAMDYGEECGVLNQTQIQALRLNIEKLAVGFRDRFHFTEQDWQSMTTAMAQRHSREKPACGNAMATKFALDVSRDIIALSQ